METLDNILIKTKEASFTLASASNEVKNRALASIAKSILDNTNEIIEANRIDLNNAVTKGVNKVMYNRLELTLQKIEDIVNSIYTIINLEDPVNKVLEENVRPNGLIIKKVSVPFGVLCAIFESRPNVCVDIAVLAIKSGNACILRGGSEAINTNIALVKIMRDAIDNILPSDCISLIEDTNRDIISKLVTSRGQIDLIFPRGGKELIKRVCLEATVPVIETGAGNCHLYVHKNANITEAINIMINAKVSKPAVCNSIESVVIDEDIASEFLKKAKIALEQNNVEIRGCKKTRAIIECKEASEEDFYTEYNDLIISIKVVKDYMEAINHINKYSTKHSETIVTDNNEVADIFLKLVDSSCVYHNASTRFTDGGEFGFGAELGISTQKLHARGPMGLKEMTTYKYKIYGNGQIRG